MIYILNIYVKGEVGMDNLDGNNLVFKIRINNFTLLKVSNTT